MKESCCRDYLEKKAYVVEMACVVCTGPRRAHYHGFLANSHSNISASHVADQAVAESFRIGDITAPCTGRIPLRSADASLSLVPPCRWR